VNVTRLLLTGEAQAPQRLGYKVRASPAAYLHAPIFSHAPSELLAGVTPELHHLLR
jgi:hypothetical protein